MNDPESFPAGSGLSTRNRLPEMTIPELVGEIYDSAPIAERCRLLEHLLKPIGVLGLVGLCNGIFAKIWFRNGWHDLHIHPEDARTIRVADVISLADYVQQASSETIHGLGSLLASSPIMAYSAAAAMLVALLVRRDQIGDE